MMKNYLYAIVLLLVGCTADEQLENILGSGTSGREPVPVTFSVSEVLDLTRASSSIVTFDANEAIKVLVKPNGEDTYTGYTYTTASAGQSNITLTPPETPPYYPAGTGTTVQAYAYYPADAGESATFTVANDQTSNANYKASDLMFATNRTITKGSDNGNNNLRMSHLMSQLHLNVTGTALSIHRVIVVCKREVSFNDAAGTVALTETPADTIVAATAAGSAYVCIPPQAINTVVVKVETGGPGDAENTATFEFTSTSNFESGKSYPISLNVSRTHLGTTSTIADWDGTSPYAAGYMTIDNIAMQVYDATAKTPNPVVKFNGVTLTKDVDYTVEYVRNVEPGWATVVVKGKEGTAYEGATVMKNFMIMHYILNPLYYMADYNSLDATTFATVDDAGYCFTWNQSMGDFAAQTTSYDGYCTAGKGPNGKWHLPTYSEWLSVLPGSIGDPFQTVLFSEDGTLKENFITPKWGCNYFTKNLGVSETSWFKKISETEVHAVRFIGTDYVSAWKYKYLNNTLYIYSIIIAEDPLTKDNVEDWYTEYWDTGRYAMWGDNLMDGRIARRLYYYGYSYMKGSSSPGSKHNDGAYYRCTTESSETFSLYMTAENSIFCYWHIDWHKANGMPVRLFLDRDT